MHTLLLCMCHLLPITMLRRSYGPFMRLGSGLCHDHAIFTMPLSAYSRLRQCFVLLSSQQSMNIDKREYRRSYETRNETKGSHCGCHDALP